MLWNVYSLMILLSSATFLLFFNFPLACLYGTSLYFHALAGDPNIDCEKKSLSIVFILLVVLKKTFLLFIGCVTYIYQDSFEAFTIWLKLFTLLSSSMLDFFEKRTHSGGPFGYFLPPFWFTILIHRLSDLHMQLEAIRYALTVVTCSEAVVKKQS